MYAAAAATAAVIIVIIAVFSINLNNRKLSEDVRKKEIQIDELYSIIKEYSNDINELRRKLYLPEKDYLPDTSSVSKENKQEEKASNSEINRDLAFYLAADKLLSFNERLKNLRILNTFTENIKFKNLLKSNGFFLRKNDDKGFVIVYKDRIAYRIGIKSDNPFKAYISCELESFGEKSFYPEKENSHAYAEEFITTSADSIKEHIERVYQSERRFENIVNDKRIKKIIKEYELTFTSDKTPEALNLNFYTKDGIVVLKTAMNIPDMTYEVDDEAFKDYDIFIENVYGALSSADKRTAEEKEIDKAKKKIISVSADAAFKEYLDKKKLSLLSTPREDSDYYYFDFINSNNVRQGSLGVQKHIGDIYLFDSEDVVITSLKSLSYYNTDKDVESSGFIIPENIADYSSKFADNGTLTLLLIGSHEKNADTIILANFTEKKIKLISIPRDLYYKNRKVNDYYRTGGGELFSEVISDITGLKIAGYVGVDMYAFIDVINILGGIDVELKSDLSDPTYKIRDNGIWKTLYYSKGKHHLNGLEALRIARSRHTSSDFGRSDRQQLILKGVKDKLNELNISDMDKVYSIFKTADRYLDTNISTMEMISIFMKYKNADIEKKDGLSIFNVLYNTYSNIYNLKDKSRQFDDNFNRGAWILLPRNDDWNVIKWYINGLINE